MTIGSLSLLSSVSRAQSRSGRNRLFLRVPKVFNLRTDPFERADITSNTYWDWLIDRVYLTYAAQFLVREFLETFKEFPPRMKPASFSIDKVLEKMEQSFDY